VFTQEERDRVRQRLLEAAEADPDVVGAAIVGSYAAGRSDRWSDIDLTFAVTDVPQALARWTGWLDQWFGVRHHWDLPVGGSTFRVFLLPGWLEVDLGFRPALDFGARGPNWRTVFGEEVPLPPAPAESLSTVAGLGWHHGWQAYVCVQRGRSWQAVHWLNALRDQVFALVWLRHDLPTAFAKEHQLPDAMSREFDATLARSLEPDELMRALSALLETFDSELRRADPDLAERINPRSILAQG
jgi:predicted nucleotidyltransferase